jgi:hypothetical protein
MNAIEAIEALTKALEAGSYNAAPARKLVDEIEFEIIPAKDDRYPHKCPRCKGPAYIGLNKIDCKAKC